MLLFGTIGAEAYLRPDGSVRIYHDFGEGREEWGWKEASDIERMQAIVIASERHPELRRLIPIRPDQAVNCDPCHGSGYLWQSIHCGHCGGLGWLRDAAT